MFSRENGIQNVLFRAVAKQTHEDLRDGTTEESDNLNKIKIGCQARKTK